MKEIITYDAAREKQMMCVDGTFSSTRMKIDSLKIAQNDERKLPGRAGDPVSHPVGDSPDLLGSLRLFLSFAMELDDQTCYGLIR